MEQGELLPKTDSAGPPGIAALNEAKQLAWDYASDAVRLLGACVNDPEYDMDTRISAADCLLQFIARGPF